MSQAEELLNSIEATTFASADVEVEETHIIVDSQRYITVPESLKRLGVQYDHNIETVTFDCPRYWDGHDMAEMKIYVNYMCPDGVKGKYLATNVKVNYNTMNFDWVISNNVTQAAGKLSFLVCIMRTDADGNEERHWNSELNQECYISSGLECDEIPLTLYPDIITQLLLRMDEVEAVATAENLRSYTIEWLEANHDTLLAEIEAKAQEVLNSIPEDYTEVANLVKESVRTKADAIVLETNGEDIFVDDAGDSYIRNIRVFGKTTQALVANPNLFDYTSLVGSVNTQIGSGATVQYSRSNGIDRVFLNGTAQTSQDKTLGTIILTESTAVTLSANNPVSPYTSSNDHLFIKNAEDTVVLNAPFGVAPNCYVTTTLEAGTYSYGIGVNAGSTFSDLVLQPKLEIGSVATEFTPYVAGEPAINPDYRATIDNLASPVISIYGKNLVNLIGADSNWNGITYTINEDGTILVNGTATDLSYYNFDITVPAGDYVFTGCPEGGNVNTGYFIRLVSNDVIVNDDAGGGFEFSLAEDSPVIIRLVVRKGCTVNYKLFKPMIRSAICDDATYEQYKEAQSLIISRDIPGVPVVTGGNYIDSDGQHWICDEIDFERGVYVHRTNTVNLSDYVAKNCTAPDNSTYSDLIRRFDFGSIFGVRINTPVICNRFTYKNAHVDDMAAVRSTECISSHSIGDTLSVFIDSDRLISNDITGFAAWLNENPTTVLYILDTPTETSLTADELAAFEALRTNRTNTTVLNDKNAYMVMKYNADLQTWISTLVSKINGSSGGNVLVDDVTGTVYSLRVSNGKLMMDTV